MNTIYHKKRLREQQREKAVLPKYTKDPRVVS